MPRTIVMMPNFAASAVERGWLDQKLLREMGAQPGELVAARKPLRCRKKYLFWAARVERLTAVQYRDVRPS